MRVAAVVAAAGLVLGGVAAAPAPAGAADGTGVVTYLGVRPEPVTVDGLVSSATVVTVWAEVQEPRGAITSNGTEDWYYNGVLATVERTAGGPHDSAAFELHATGFSPGDYEGGWRVASTRSGTWTVTRLTWYVMGVGFTSVDPRVAPGVTRTFTVVGTHVPTVSSVRIPRVVAYGGRQWVQYAVRTSTGAPAVGLPVRSADDMSCALPQVPPTAVTAGLRTDATGRVTIRLYTFSNVRCVDIWSRPALTTSPETAAVLARSAPTRYEYYKWVSAVPTATAVRINRTLTVVGSAYPTRGVVRLQRLVGRTWRTVASAPIRTSGRYTVATLVTNLGRTYYRVVALNGDRTLAPTPSRVVLVTGTRR